MIIYQYCCFTDVLSGLPVKRVLLNIYNPVFHGHRTLIRCRITLYTESLMITGVCLMLGPVYKERTLPLF